MLCSFDSCCAATDFEQALSSWNKHKHVFLIVIIVPDTLACRNEQRAKGVRTGAKPLSAKRARPFHPPALFFIRRQITRGVCANQPTLSTFEALVPTKKGGRASGQSLLGSARESWVLLRRQRAHASSSAAYSANTGPTATECAFSGPRGRRPATLQLLGAAPSAECGRFCCEKGSLAPALQRRAAAFLPALIGWIITASRPLNCPRDIARGRRRAFELRVEAREPPSFCSRACS